VATETEESSAEENQEENSDTEAESDGSDAGDADAVPLSQMHCKLSEEVRMSSFQGVNVVYWCLTQEPSWTEDISSFTEVVDDDPTHAREVNAPRVYHPFVLSRHVEVEWS
jgi:hypothetical protein